MLQSMGWQKVRHNWDRTELNAINPVVYYTLFSFQIQFSLITLGLSPLLVKRQVLYDTESLTMLSASNKLIPYLLKLNYSGPLVSACVCAKLLQLCLNICNPINHSPPGSSVHDSPGENTVPFFRGSFRPKDWIYISLFFFFFLFLKFTKLY